jgi:hypothetical protein
MEVSLKKMKWVRRGAGQNSPRAEQNTGFPTRWVNAIGHVCALLYIEERLWGAIAVQDAAIALLQRLVKLIAMKPAVRSA